MQVFHVTELSVLKINNILITDNFFNYLSIINTQNNYFLTGTLVYLLNSKLIINKGIIKFKNIN